MQEYNPGHFADVGDTPLGHELWEFLNEADNVLRMETASELRRPAIEPLAARLTQRFGDKVRQDRVKQMLGHMVRQLLEARGFIFDRPGVRVRVGDLFSVASRYKRFQAPFPK